MDLAINRNELYVLIKEAVRDVLKEEEFSFFLKSIPIVSKEEMKEIEKTFGKPSRKRESAFSETIDIESDTQRIRPEKSEVERLWADNSKAKKLTDWAPAYGGVEGLKRGLQETVTWFTKAENLRQYKPDEYNI